LGVINQAGLPSYFLIVQDFMNHGRSQNWILGPGRGCLSHDTPVIMEDGTTKPIVEIKPGERVISRDGQPHSVLNRFEYDCDEDLLKICSYYGDSAGVTLTKDHEVLVDEIVRPKNYHRLSDATKSS